MTKIVETTWATLLETCWIYCYFLNGIGLDLDPHSSSFVQKIPN